MDLRCALVWLTQVLAGDGRIIRLHRKVGIAPDEEEYYRAEQARDRPAACGTPAAPSQRRASEQ
jgi:hypothetical protein